MNPPGRELERGGHQGASPVERAGPDASNRRLSAILRSGLAIVLLTFLFRRIPLASVADTAASAAPLALLAAFGFGLLAHVAVAERLRRLVEPLGLRLSTAALFQVDLAAVFYGLVLPAGNVAGILARFYGISRHEANYAGIGVALVFERLVTTLTLCVLGVVFWLLDWPASWPALAFLIAGVAAVLALYVTLFNRAPPGLMRLRRAIERFLPKKLASVRGALRRSRKLPIDLVTRVFTISVVSHLLGIGAFAFVAGGLGLDLSLATVAWTRSAAMLIATLPISVAGLGVREGAMVVLLAPYGVPDAEALAYSLLAFATTILAVGVVGGLAEARRLLR